MSILHNFFSKGQPKSLPYPIYFFSILGIALCGLAVSIYLSISHYRVYTDIGYRSFCAISKAINCDTVSQSPYSIFGGIPVPMWGVIGYAFILLLLPFAWNKAADKKRIWTLVFLISFVFSCISIVLAFISSYFVGSYCILCIFTYGVNFLLLFISWIVRRRFSSDNIIGATNADFVFLLQQRKKFLAFFLPFVVAVTVTIFFFPTYWKFEPPAHSSTIPTGVTEEGHPWIGSKQPALEIVEFSDYQCFQCKKMHFFLRQLVANNPSQIRLIHRNYPMDHEFNFIVKEPFHVGSGKMALLAIYASSGDKFWQMNDALYEIAGKTDSIDVKALAEKLQLEPARLAGTFTNPEMRHKLRVDIWTGMKNRILGTPSYLINGKVYQGNIPPEIIKNFLN